MYLGIERRQSLNRASRGTATVRGGICPVEAVELHPRVEVRLKAKTPEARFSRAYDETRRLLYELQVRQIELELQNAQMRLAGDEVETTLEKYSDLYDFAPVGYLTLDRDGAIRAVNLTGARLLGIDRARLLGRRFGLFVAGTARHAFSEFLGRVFNSPTKEACELPLLQGGGTSAFCANRNRGRCFRGGVPRSGNRYFCAQADGK